MFKKCKCILLLLLLDLSFIFAQTCCTGGTQLLGTYIPTAIDKGELKGHFSFNYNRISDIILEDKKLNESFIKREVTSYVLQLDYGIGESFSISLIVPYLHQKETISNGNGFVFTSTGIGDLSVWGQFHKRSNYLNVNLSAGVKIPTGSTGESTSGIPVPLSMQLGSGSYDFGFNLRVSYYLNRLKTIAFENQTAIILTTPGGKFEAHSNYMFGNQFQFMGALSYRNLLKAIQMNSFMGLTYQYRGNDLFDGGFENENTGGHWVNFIVGETLSISPNIDISLNALFPLHRQLNGLQLSTTWLGSLSISYLIHRKDEIINSTF